MVYSSIVVVEETAHCMRRNQTTFFTFVVQKRNPLNDIVYKLPKMACNGQKIDFIKETLKVSYHTKSNSAATNLCKENQNIT